MKKIISLLLACMCCMIFAVTAFAANPQIVVSEVTAERGDEIVITVSVKNNPGVSSMKLEVKYDTDVLEYKSSAISNNFGGVPATSESNGKVQLNWMLFGSDSTTNGVFAEIKFKVKDNAIGEKSAVEVSYNPEDVCDKNMDNVAFETVNGGVTVNVPCQHTDTKIINAKEATCCENGYTGDTYCNECKTIIAKGSETAKNPDNHVGGTEVKGAKEATCAEKGYTGDTYCKGCGAVIAKGSKITKDADNHVGGTEVKGAKEATCAEKGYTGDTHCKGCGAVVAKGSETAKDADNHVGGTEVKGAKEATCTEKGYTGDTHCKGCGAKLESGEEIAMLDHKGGKATCAEKAKCEVCGNEYGEIDADAHTLKYETVKEPTCTEKGERKITCENGCGYEESEDIDALDHDWGEWKTVKEATTEEKGLEERECERCGEKESRETEKLDKPTNPSRPSKPSKPDNDNDTDEEDEANPNTGAAVKYGSVLGAVAIVAVAAFAAKRRK
ncbi:MAG: hypothetical protein IJA17_05930 [Oscillospiraceae bacterium]|nr:hypothetical protein [Oscillospiraceae bacterium]